MISANDLFKRRSKSEGRTFLKYSELQGNLGGARMIEVQVLAVRVTPRLNSPAVLDISPDMWVDGKPYTTPSTSIPINLTNLQLMGAAVGDDIEVLAGQRVKFGFGVKNNPNASGLDTEVMGFEFIGVSSPSDTAQAPAAAPAAGSRRNRR